MGSQSYSWPSPSHSSQTPPTHLPPGCPCPPVDDEVPVQVLQATEHLEHDAFNLGEVQKHRVESFETLPGSHQQPARSVAVAMSCTAMIVPVPQCTYLLYMYERVTRVFVYVWVCAPVCEHRRLTSGVFINCFLPYILKQHLLFEPRAGQIQRASLPGNPVSTICLMQGL